MLLTNYHLGMISEKYESGGAGPGTISIPGDDPGGASYGVHQLAINTGTLRRYVQQSRFRNQFAQYELGSPEFNKYWRWLARHHTKAFSIDQLNFIKRTHFDKLREYADSLGLPWTYAINEALFSMGVQHGGAKKIVLAASKEVKENPSEMDWVLILYEARKEYVNKLSLSKRLKKVLNDRYDREVLDVMELIS